MNPINPYRRNCEVMRRFFSKPIFLLLGIVFSLSVFSGIALSILNSSLQINILNILPIIAFFLFYFKSKSNSPLVSFNAPITIMKVYSIINIVLMGLSLLLFMFVILMFVGLQTGSAYLPEEFSAFINIFLPFFTFIAMPEIIVNLLFSIAMLILFNSFKNSTSTIYLHKKGSVFFAVTSIFLIISSISALIITPLYINDLMDSIMNLALASTYTVGVDVADINMDTNTISSIITYTIEIITSILFAVLGFSYNNYIRKLSTSIGIENSQTYFSTAPVISDSQEGEYSPMNMWNSPENNPYQSQQPDGPSPVSMWGDTTPVNIWSETPSVSVPAAPVAPVQKQTPEEPNIPAAPTAVQTPIKPVEFDPQPVFPNTSSESVKVENLFTEKQSAPHFEVSPPNVPGQKKCDVCGKINPTDCMFCGGCGTKLK